MELQSKASNLLFSKTTQFQFDNPVEDTNNTEDIDFKEIENNDDK